MVLPLSTSDISPELQEYPHEISYEQAAMPKPGEPAYSSALAPLNK
jgi:hypothetical protein